MKQHYLDIIERIDEEPLFYDVYGVPRYGNPDNIPECLMPTIACQLCGRQFRVAMVEGVYWSAWIGATDDPSNPFYSVVQHTERWAKIQSYLRERYTRYHPDAPAGVVPWEVRIIEDKYPDQCVKLREDWGYGDPPRHNCAGDSMTSEPVLED